MNTKSIFLFFFIFPSLQFFAQDNDSIKSTGPVGMTVSEFNQKTKSVVKPLLVYFTANWCVVCKRQKPVLEQIITETAGQLEVLSLNMEDNPLIAEYFEVDGLPALILYKDGHMIWNRIGFQENTKIMEQISPFLKRK